MIVALVLLCASVDLDHYRARLQEIDRTLARGDTAAAAAMAATLQELTIRAGGEELAPDRWALGPIARGQPHRARLRSLIGSLAPEGAAPPAPEPALLERLRSQQKASRPAAGGEVRPLDAPGLSLPGLIQQRLRIAARYVARQFHRFLRWLGGLFPEAEPGAAASEGRSRVVPLVFAAVGAILAGLAALAVLSLRRGARGQVAPAVRERPVADEDPRSRTASGWEQRARELAAQGRAREAIRAWYHAVLVRCAAAGLLHPRPGRTNWEYAHALPAAVPWRGRFEDLTSRFDVEWYGHSASSEEALSAFADGAAEILRALGRNP